MTRTAALLCDRRRAVLALARCAVLLVSLGNFLAGQHYSFRSYGERDDLSSTSVRCLFQDHIGFLWIGTSNGLFRYDGVRFTRFDTADGLPSIRISSIHETEDGTIWVAANNGLARWKSGRFERVELYVKNSFYLGSVLASDGAGNLFVATGEGLFIGKAEGRTGAWSFQRANVRNMESSTVHLVYVDPKSNLWVGSDQQLYLLQKTDSSYVAVKQNVPRDHWSTLRVDSHGGLWLRSARHLLHRPRGSGRFVARDRGLPFFDGDGAPFIEVDGQLLVPTDLGLAVGDGQQWNVVGESSGLPGDSASAVLMDREGSVWVGLNGTGLARWIGFSQWEDWTRIEGLVNSHVRAIFQDASGTMWAGTNFGLYFLKSGARSWQEQRTLHGQRIVAIAKDSRNLWLGCNPGGVFRLDSAGRVEHYGPKSGLKNQNVLALTVDADEHLWVTAEGGLYRSAGAQSYAFRDMRPRWCAEREMYSKCLLRRNGEIWVGAGRQLCRYKDKTWTQIRVSGLLSDKISYLAESQDGSIWLAYREDRSITQLVESDNRISVKHHRPDSGSRPHRARFLGVDARGWMWAGSDNGVDVFDRSKWTHYSQKDGLLWDYCNSNAVFPAGDGSVWIGTPKGVTTFRPRNHAPSIPPPPAVLVSGRLGSRGIAGGRLQTVPHFENTFIAQLGALSFLNEELNRFRYRLLGLEENWTDTVQPEVRYSSLAPGKYQFQFLVQNARGDWTEAPSEVSFEIRPPWWRSFWCLGLDAGIVLLAIRYIWRLRMRNIERERDRLEEAVAERTRQLAEEKLSAEEATRCKGMFLANMSHEIRTPMNGIIGMAELALETQSNEDRRDYLMTVKTSAESLLAIINDVLDFSKIEAGKLTLDPHDFCPEDVIRSVVKLMALPAHQKGLELICDVAPDIPSLVVGDSGRLRQVMLNLVGNAIKFTSTGEVNLRARTVRFAEHSTVLEFAVSDTGIGIPEKVRESIFEAFIQADGSTTRRFGGSGLGLAISSRLVQLMGGRLFLESEIGHGSTFYFRVEFPNVEAGAKVEAAVVPASAGMLRGLSVLVVDDNRTNRLMLFEMLAQWGINPVLAESGARALEILHGEAGPKLPFNLILIDAHMPDMDGFTLAGRLHQEMERAPTPIVMLSSSDLVVSQRNLKERHVYRYLVKPVMRADLLNTILGTLTSSELPKAVIQQHQQPAQSCGLRILLAEDNAVNQKVATRLLERDGHHVLLAKDGAEALEVFRCEAPDLILMDVQMPELNGYEVTARIRSEEQNTGKRRTPIVALTAHAMKGDRELCVAAGMDDYLSKPIRQEELRAVIGRWRAPESSSDCARSALSTEPQS